MTVAERYRCPEQSVRTSPSTLLSAEERYFRFGPDLVCYGGTRCATPVKSPSGHLPDLLAETKGGRDGLELPFDPAQVVENFTHERYLAGSSPNSTWLRTLYYSLRPLLPAAVRLPLHRVYFRDWRKIAFPAWPVDVSVERLLERVLLLSMKARGIDAMPFIWFWPDGASGAVIITHDVETARGRDLCPRLMNLDESAGVRASFQMVPERRYSVSQAFLDEIRGRGHEVGVHDLNHDGRLFHDRRQFLERVKAINAYGRLWRAKGFRSAILYRNLDWFDALEFDYDMSVPNVGHLEPQRGGCCTVFPYFVGDVLEIPVTTVQDHSLTYILHERHIGLWKTQAEMVLERHGLLSFLTHPDYLPDSRVERNYRALLEFLTELRTERKVWIALPGQVSDWWRQRSKMSLVQEGNGWRIEGPGKKRARLAYAKLDGDRLIYTCQTGAAAHAAESPGPTPR